DAVTQNSRALKFLDAGLRSNNLVLDAAGWNQSALPKSPVHSRPFVGCNEPCSASNARPLQWLAVMSLEPLSMKAGRHRDIIQGR
ncbi:unnamed protein product, partial [Polarella glacialis]